MNILITGGTGLIGQHLIETLLANQSLDYNITVLTRDPLNARTVLPKGVQCIDSLDAITHFDDVNAIINLAGEPIADKRWTVKQKTQICNSRWQITEQLVTKIMAAKRPPECFISGSAIGFYGSNGNRAITEEDNATEHDFSHSLCTKWEAIAMEAATKSRLCLLRTGVVLAKQGGALAKMRLPFSLGLGGRIGSGEQYMSWIHIKDMVAAILFLLTRSDCRGAYNLTAPTPVTNKVFTKAYASALGRPAIFPVPALALKMLMGESSELLLGGQQVMPKRLLDAGFQYTFSDINSAFADLV